MEKAYREIERLVQVDAKHKRKNYKLSEFDNIDLLKHAAEELVELVDAPNDLEELCDVVTCLLHYAIRKRWSLDMMESNILHKLSVRFSKD